ncbi:LacI family DNA-binding transcriptional regulator [Propionibacterium freudenreichii]|nr:LacI family transcriptional regulator [Propionibacterium freudenreichii]MDK9647533.1 LacI family DNA-binding transcriptional regulator [Propionibacterium freudenreichii]MDK9655744.1 LacI family DNA-binding transcriptional regulator [Propionibacterium freudenreichii]MDK9666840.1 LacI family DNA-binding transcriptional regulator [Propionibacterium freudenreichii]CEG94226.1 HTH-type transcriptional repressor CytR [Propionibacterium freudenreichii]
MSLSAVARSAGVSVSTVSRYVRGELHLRPETAEAIARAMDETGYHPVADPRQADRVVAVVVPELTNPFFAELAQGLAHSALRQSLGSALYLTNGDPRRETEVIESLTASTDVNGIFCIGMSYDNPTLAKPRTTPIVMVDEPAGPAPGVVLPFVGPDNYGGALAATSYLASLGHRRIAHIGGPSNVASSDLRELGYRDALSQAGLPIDESIIYRGAYSETFGANTLGYVARAEQRPTAVFAASDATAIGVISAAPIHGLRLPEDLSIIGFDGIRIGSWLRPALSSVAQPIPEIVDAALSTMGQLWAGQTPPDTMLPMKLVIRDSARPPSH